MNKDEIRYLVEIILYATAENSTLIEISKREYELNGGNLFQILPLHFFRDDVNLSIEVNMKAKRTYKSAGPGMVELVSEEKLD